jgi:hypothetical protein
MHEWDLRQHRLGLTCLMMRGEKLAIEAFSLDDLENKENYVRLIDVNNQEMLATLHAWHSSVESQTDIPEPFKQGIRDSEKGKIVDMETAMNTAPGAV